MALKDSLAVILDLHPEKCFLHAFTYPDWKHVTSFGKRGEGPDDILSAERVRICSPYSVWVLDRPVQAHRTRWRISNGNAERVEEINLDERLNTRVWTSARLTRDFWATDNTGNYRYHALDQCGKIMQSVGHVPSEKSIDDSDKVALAQAWRSFNGLQSPKRNTGNGYPAWRSHRDIQSENRRSILIMVHMGNPCFHISQGYGLPSAMTL